MGPDRKSRPEWLVRTTIMMVIAAGALVGCATSDFDWNYRAKPPAREKDVADCTAIAKPEIPQRGITDAGVTYAGCMVARGYLVLFGIDARGSAGIGIGEPLVYVEATRPHDGNEAAQDLRDCRKAAEEAVSTGSKAAAYWGLGVGIGAGIIFPKLEQAFAGCIEPRGYRWSRWEPER